MLSAVPQTERPISSPPLHAALMMQRLQLPLPSHSKMNAIHKTNQGHMLRWGGGGGYQVFTCSFHPPRHVNAEEGNGCQWSRCSTKAPDCILDSDMLLFLILQRNQMFRRSVTDSLTDCPPPPLPNVFESNPALGSALQLPRMD